MKIEEDKSLVDVSDEKKNKFSFLYFFQKVKSLLKKNKKKNCIERIEEKNTTKEDNSKRNFINSIKVEESEESQLLKLQKKYSNGEIKEADLSEEQISKLIDLYDKQIDAKKKENEIKRIKIDKFKKIS